MNGTNVDRLLEKLETTLLSGKKQMFSNMYLIDVNKCLAIIQQIKSELPQDLAEAKVILRNCEKLKEEAAIEADGIIAAAQEHARTLVDENAIRQESERQAEELVKKAGAYADGLVEQSYNQVNNMYLEVENVMRNMLQQVMESRDSLFISDDGQGQSSQDMPQMPSNMPQNR